MKKIILPVLFATILSSCKDYKAEIEQLYKTQDSLTAIGFNKDSSINSFLGSMNEIQINLDSVTARQNIVVSDSRDNELSKSNKEHILSSIKAINDLMEENRRKMAEISARLKKSNVRITELQKMLAGLQIEILQKDSELVSLNQRLAAYNIQVGQLTASVDSLSNVTVEKIKIIDTQTSIIHTAYFVVGTYKELKAKNVLNKEGGFLGLGKEQKLRSDFDHESFTKIDVSTTSSITINSKDAKIVTTHPKGSYEFVKTKDRVTALNITDFEKFWHASKYLVVVTN